MINIKVNIYMIMIRNLLKNNNFFKIFKGLWSYYFEALVNNSQVGYNTNDFNILNEILKPK